MKVRPMKASFVGGAFDSFHLNDSNISNARPTGPVASCNNSVFNTPRDPNNNSHHHHAASYPLMRKPIISPPVSASTTSTTVNNNMDHNNDTSSYPYCCHPPSPIVVSTPKPCPTKAETRTVDVIARIRPRSGKERKYKVVVWPLDENTIIFDPKEKGKDFYFKGSFL